jgi:hypothetical protein
MFNLNPRVLDAAFFTLKAAVACLALAQVYEYGYAKAQLDAIAEDAKLGRVKAEAAEGAAEAIRELKNDLTPQVIVQRTREVPIYRECQHDPGVFDNLNRQLTGKPSSRAD